MAKGLSRARARSTMGPAAWSGCMPRIMEQPVRTLRAAKLEAKCSPAPEFNSKAGVELKESSSSHDSKAPSEASLQEQHGSASESLSVPGNDLQCKATTEGTG